MVLDVTRSKPVPFWMEARMVLDENAKITLSVFWRLDGDLDGTCLKHCLKPVPFWMEKVHGWKVGW